MTFEEWWLSEDNPWNGAEMFCSEYYLAKAAWNASRDTQNNN